MTVTRSRVFVEGRVQGVWFRESTRRIAEDLGLAGWVRNLADGRVEAVFEGDPEKVARAVDWARHGPDHAFVSGIEVSEEAPAHLSGFAIKPTYGDG